MSWKETRSLKGSTGGLHTIAETGAPLAAERPRATKGQGRLTPLDRSNGAGVHREAAEVIVRRLDPSKNSPPASSSHEKPQLRCDHVKEDTKQDRADHENQAKTPVVEQAVTLF